MQNQKQKTEQQPRNPMHFPKPASAYIRGGQLRQRCGGGWRIVKKSFREAGDLPSWANS